jgi:CRP-like cAMP-binding protein
MTVTDYESESFVALDIANPCGLYYVVSGLLAVNCCAPSKDSLKQASILKPPGSFIGMEHIWTDVNSESTASLNAICDARVGFISQLDLANLLRGDLHDMVGPLREALFAELANAYLELRKGFEIKSFATIGEQVLRALVSLADVTGTPHRQGTVVEIKQTLLAGLIGASDESARRGLVDLIKKGRIAIAGKSKYILFNE